MKSFLDKIARLRVGWNERPLDEVVFQQLCDRRRIKVTSMPLASVDGFYTCDKKRHYIAVNSKLGEFRRTFVGFHEFAHYLMHSPRTDATSNYCGSQTHSRDEDEADAFAYCALLPLEIMRSRPDAEIAEMYGMVFFLERLRVYERYGI